MVKFNFVQVNQINRRDFIDDKTTEFDFRANWRIEPNNKINQMVIISPLSKQFRPQLVAWETILNT